MLYDTSVFLYITYVMRRNDAKQVFDIPTYNKIFPFMLKRRCDSLVYHALNLDVTPTVEYIRNYNAQKPERRMKFFYVFCAALMRTFALRPELNRFIASKRYWQRNELSMNFVVKEDFTDEAPETSNPLTFRPDMVLEEYADIIDKYIEQSRERKEENFTDYMIDRVLNFPTWAIAGFVRFIGWLDNRGKSPKFVHEADGLHTSVFVANLGSIGVQGGSPHHHLYEWGTTSVFVTLGQLERHKKYDDEGNHIATKETIQIGATVDERISSGFYFIKSMQVLQDLLLHPEKLEERPVLPPPVLTKKQYNAKMKAQRKAAKESKKK